MLLKGNDLFTLKGYPIPSIMDPLIEIMNRFMVAKLFMIFCQCTGNTLLSVCGLDFFFSKCSHSACVYDTSTKLSNDCCKFIRFILFNNVYFPLFISHP